MVDSRPDGWPTSAGMARREFDLPPDCADRGHRRGMASLSVDRRVSSGNRDLQRARMSRLAVSPQVQHIRLSAFSGGRLRFSDHSGGRMSGLVHGPLPDVEDVARTASVRETRSRGWPDGLLTALPGRERAHPNPGDDRSPVTGIRHRFFRLTQQAPCGPRRDLPVPSACETASERRTSGVASAPALHRAPRPASGRTVPPGRFGHPCRSASRSAGGARGHRRCSGMSLALATRASVARYGRHFHILRVSLRRPARRSTGRRACLEGVRKELRMLQVSSSSWRNGSELNSASSRSSKGATPQARAASSNGSPPC